MESLVVSQVISSIDSIKKVYAALCIRRKPDGDDVGNIDTSFQKPLEEMTDRRLRDLLSLLWLPVKVVLDAFHADTVGLLRLLLGRAETETNKDAKRKMLVESMADLPLVQDIVAAINNANDTDDAAEERRLLSLLTETFRHKELTDLGFKKTVSKYK